MRGRKLLDIEQYFWVFITSNCKSPQSFDFSVTELSFRFIWIKKFSKTCYFRWEDGTYFLSSVLFGQKNVGDSTLEWIYKGPYQTWPTTVAIFRKHQNVPTRTQKKIQILLLRRSLNKYTSFFSKTPYLWRGDISEKLSRVSNFSKNLWEKSKGYGTGNAKVVGRMGFFQY